MPTNSVFLFGYSGHSYVILDSLEALGVQVSGYFDYSEAAQNPYQLAYCGFEKNVPVQDIIGTNGVFPSVGENSLREKMVRLFGQLGLQQLTIQDPSAIVSRMAKIQSSVYIGRGAIVNALAIVGTGAIVNTGALIEHECVVGDYCHIAPNATLAGNVTVGKGSFVGAGAVVKQGITIGEGCIVGAGSVVVKDIPDMTVYVGNPAKFLKNVG